MPRDAHWYELFQSNPVVFRIDTELQTMRMSAVYMHLFRYMYALTQCIPALERLISYAHWQQ